MKKLITLVYAAAILLGYTKINAQVVNPPSHTATAANEYVGWDGTGANTKDLDLTNLFSGKNITFNTNNTGTNGSSTTKMTILGNNGSTSGFVGIGLTAPQSLPRLVLV